MSGTNIALLGAIAGLTIYLGLPVGRIRAGLPRLKAALNAIAIGILLFLVWDVLSQAWEPVDRALGHQRWAAALGSGLVMAAGLTAGLAGLAQYDRWAATRRARASRPGGPAPSDGSGGPAGPAGTGPGGAGGASRAARPGGPGAAAVTELTGRTRSTAGEIAMMIATGIGLHNFAEGLAIGNSAANGEISLATLLVIGFGLHNATEGFGIVAPLAAAGERPSWLRLFVLGLIGGGPTFVGTVVGQNVVNDTLSVAFLGLAAGSILFVVFELLAVARRTATKEFAALFVALGMILGFATDAVVTAAGV